MSEEPLFPTYEKLAVWLSYGRASCVWHWQYCTDGEPVEYVRFLNRLC